MLSHLKKISVSSHFLKSQAPYFFIFLFLSITLISFAPNNVRANENTTEIFNRDLKIGMYGDDVLELQKILNRSKDTIISLSGPGSAGNETNYFGKLTESAVKRFQEKNYKEILAPIGLNTGTGHVGKKTREFLNKMYAGVFNNNVSIDKPVPTSDNNDTNNSVNTTSSDNTNEEELAFELFSKGVINQSSAFSSFSDKDAFIFGLSHQIIKKGDTLTISGVNFSNENKFYIGNIEVKPLSISNKKVTLKIPEIKNGSYQVWLTGKNINRYTKTKHFIKVSDSSIIRPHILSVNPTYPTKDSVIRVEAERLDKKDNTLYTALGIINKLELKDDRYVEFKIEDLPNYKDFLKANEITDYNVTFTISSSAGISDNYGYIHISK